MQDYFWLAESAVAAAALGGIAKGAQKGIFLWQRSAWYATRQAMKIAFKPVVPFTLKPPESMQPNPRLERRIEEALRVQTSGVQVLNAPSGMGKTTAVRNVLCKLQKNNQAGAIVINCEEMNQYLSETNTTSMYAALRHVIWNQMRIPSDSKISHNLSSLFAKASPPRVVVFLDQFELLCPKDSSSTEAERLVKGLALDAVQAGSYTVLLTVNSQKIHTVCT